MFVLITMTACGGGDNAAVDDANPESVVSGFVAAEAAGSYDASYALLRAADREEVGSVEDWRELHADAWPVDSGEVVGTSSEGDQATVEMRMRFHAGIEDAVGLVPARGNARWLAVREDGRWRIAFNDVRIEAVYPEDGAAPGRVADWAKARQACGPAPEYGDGLVGFPALADQLCKREGAVEAGPAGPLEAGPDGDAVVAAFGPEALTWARVVALTEPGGLLRAVVAPIGEEWTVIGVLSPAPTT
jgi:head-tail adaptor